MKYLKTIRDSDIFSIPKYKDHALYEERQTVKIIIKNENNEIGLVTNPIHNLFILPGGGTETDDLEKEAGREALEETNFHVKIFKEIGKIEEFRNREAKHYLTTCFFAKSTKEGSEDLRTEEEKENGLEVKWFNLKDALIVMGEQVDMVEKGEVKFYNTAFNVVRDYNFLSKFDFEINKVN